jgi:hypothetical protein
MIAEVLSRHPDEDASLIAAAPALLEALESIEPLIKRAKMTGNGVYLDEACAKARAAIRAAKGETQ